MNRYQSGSPLREVVSASTMEVDNGQYQNLRPSPSFQIDEETARCVGQMMVVSFDGFVVSDDVRMMIERYYVGNIMLSHRNIIDAKQLADLTKELQGIAHAAGLQSPLMIGIDEENGMLSRFGDGRRATQFPGAMTLGANRFPQEAYKIGEATGRELAAVGINWCSLVLDVVSDPDGSGISVRSFGDDPHNVGRLGEAFVDGLRIGRVKCCVKHFPGARPMSGRQGYQTIEEMESTDLRPYAMAMSRGLDSVRLSSFVWSDNPHDVYAKYVVHDILRERMRYTGVVVADCTEMPSFVQGSNIAQAAVGAVKAGADILTVLHSTDTQVQAIEAIYDALSREEIFRSEVHRASKRIHTLKEASPSIDWKMAFSPNPSVLPQLMNEHQILARRVHEGAITVVRDDQSLLPLNRKIASTDIVLLLTPIVRPLHPTPPGELPTDPFEPLGRALARRHLKIRHVPYTVQRLLQLHLNLIKQAAAVIFVTVNALQSQHQRYQIQMAEEVRRICSGKSFVAIAACDPYDLLVDRSFGTYLCTYEYSHVALETAGEVIFGERHAPGMLPVAIPGIPPREQQQWFVEVWEKRRDLYTSAELWMDCLGDRWPLDATAMSVLLDRPGYSKHFVVRDDKTKQLLGLAITYTILLGQNHLIGSLAVLIVRPTHRKLGIGLKLHTVALRHLEKIKGITSIQLGSIFPRIFPGLPVDIAEEDSTWFSRRGWSFENKFLYDLHMDIETWVPPEHILRPLAEKGIVFSQCTPEQFDALIDFEVKNFGTYPGWVEKYEALKVTDDIADAVIATNNEGILAAALVFSPLSNNQTSKDIPWPRTIGERNGGMACVSVGRDFRGQGLGLGLICASIMELKQRGLKGCFVDWVDVSEYERTYKRLGFRQWSKYREIWRSPHP